MLFSVSHPLICHPVATSKAIRNVAVTVTSEGPGTVSFFFEVDCDLEKLTIPARSGQINKMTDGLWQHTCFEVFLARGGQNAYREFNFSPSGQWAAYRFSDTRRRDPEAEADGCSRPLIEFHQQVEGLALHAHLRQEHLPPGSGEFKMGLSAVLETREGDRPGFCTYWALHHPCSHPDFHHCASFSRSTGIPDNI